MFNKESIALLSKNATKMMSKNSPTILTVMGVGGLVGTTVMAVKATPKALSLIGENGPSKRFAGGLYLDSLELTKVEIVKLCWKEYIPTVIMGSLSISCIVGANSVNLKRNAALVSLYSVASTNLKDYQGKVVELMGEKKHAKVLDEVAKKKIVDSPVSNNEVIFTNQGGETLCFDAFSGRYFRSDIDKIKKVENQLNKSLLEDDFVAVNDFYYELNLPNMKVGNSIGWHVDGGLIELRLSSQLTEKNEPCVVIDWVDTPIFL